MAKGQVFIYAIVALVVVALGVYFIFGISDDSSSPTGLIVQKTLSKKEKFAEFEAEVACNIADSVSVQDAFAAMADSEIIAEKYSYTLDEVEALGNQYAEDSEYQELVWEKINDRCPDIADQLDVEAPN